MDKFIDKSVVVTGGTGGIGYEICQELLNNQIKNLAIIDMKDDENVIEKLQVDFPDSIVLFIKSNVAVQQDLEDAIQLASNTFGSIFVLINCAGICNDNLAQSTVDINLSAVINSSFFGMSLMSKSIGGEGGYIINISSIAGLNPMFVLPVYSITKAAVITFTKVMSHDFYWNKHGVKYIVICPGMTKTTILDDGDERLRDKDLLQLTGDIKNDSIIIQEPNVVAECVILALKSDKNGSIWLSSENHNSEIEHTPALAPA